MPSGRGGATAPGEGYAQGGGIARRRGKVGDGAVGWDVGAGSDIGALGCRKRGFKLLCLARPAERSPRCSASVHLPSLFRNRWRKERVVLVRTCHPYPQRSDCRRRGRPKRTLIHSGKSLARISQL